MLEVSSKILSLFSKRDRLYLVLILLMMLVTAALELLGVGLIFPFIALVADPTAVQNNRMIGAAYRLTHASSYNEFLVYSGLGLIGIYLVKNLFIGSVYYFQYSFVYNRQVALARRLLGAYVSRDYSFHLYKNSAELLRNINNDVSAVFNYVIIPALTVVAETMVALLIVILLLSVEALYTSAAVIVLGGSVYLFSRIVRKKTRDYGASQQHSYGQMIKWLNQTFGAIKQIKVTGREEYFLNKFESVSKKYAHAVGFVQTIGQLPRLLLEVIAVIGMILLMLTLLFKGSAIKTLIPTLSLFAIAVMRLIPSANRITSSITTVRYYWPSVDVVSRDIAEAVISVKTEAAEATPYRIKERIELRNVCYTYPGSDKSVIRDISIDVPRGSSVAIIGPSGSGKTTLVDILMGLYRPDRGAVLVDGKDIQLFPEGWKKAIGYVPQNIYLMDDSIRRNVAFGCRDEDIDDQRLAESIMLSQLQDLVNQLPDGLDTLVGEHGVRLSGGQRQRIGIARALYNDPDVLVLDEATSSLDSETEREISAAIENLAGKKTIIIIAHRLSTIENCNMIYRLTKGGIQLERN